MTESLSDIIARMQAAYRPHAVSPVTARRDAADSPAPSTGDRGSVLDGTEAAGVTRRGTQQIKRPGTGGPATFRPTAGYFAYNPVPATMRPAYGDVSRTTGRHMASNRKRDRDNAAAESVDAGYRQWLAGRANTERDAGDILPVGTHYPSKITARGNLGPSPRY